MLTIPKGSIFITTSVFDNTNENPKNPNIPPKATNFYGMDTKNEMMGYIGSNGNAEVVMRDVTGQEVSIPKSQINVIEKVSGSLMPAGLTAGLDKEEFRDLIGFLSKMGESGKFRVPTTRYVRRWNAVSADKDVAKKMLTEGIGYVVKNNAKLSYEPAYSKVAGDLPLDELPIIEAGTNKKISVIKFEIEVVSKGTVNFAFNSTAGMSAWVGGKPLKLNDLSGARRPGG